MKVRAKEHGQYKGRLYNPGEEFVIENGSYPIFKFDDYSNIVLKDGKPVVIGERSHLEHWMEKIKESDPPKERKGLFS